MIVKNNQDTLLDCLSSVKDCVDEIIIVDTGSTDHTKKIAALFTDKIFDFKWNDNFSDARNESLKRATGDLILWLDSDDFIPASTAHAINLVRKDNDLKAAYFLNIKNINRAEWAMDWDNNYPQLKIFPRLSEFQFEGRIHESIEKAVLANAGIELRQLNFFIEHRGYSDPEKLEEKIHRDVKMTIISDCEAAGMKPPEVFFQFRIDRYFFVYTPNIIGMYGNQYNAKLNRTVLARLEKRDVFTDRIGDFEFGITEQMELISLGYQMSNGIKKNENHYVEEMNRLNNAVMQAANG